MCTRKSTMITSAHQQVKKLDTMRNLKNLRIAVKSRYATPLPNKNGTFPFRVVCGAKDLELFKEIQGDALQTDEQTGEVTWFSSTWFPYGFIVLKEDYENLEGNPWEWDILTLDPKSFEIGMRASQMLRAMSTTRPTAVADEDEDEDADDADLAPPVPAPTTTKRLVKPRK